MIYREWTEQNEGEIMGKLENMKTRYVEVYFTSAAVEQIVPISTLVKRKKHNFCRLSW